MNEEADIQISSNNNPPHAANYAYHRHHLDPCDSPGPGVGQVPPGPPGYGHGQHRQYETPPPPPVRSNDVPKPAQGQFGHCPKVYSRIT